jgi:putative endonuclease
MQRTFYVYMMTNRTRVVIYTGVTNSLEGRLWFHAQGSARSFTKRYKIDRLVYYEDYDDPREAIAREKEIKGWRRQKKNELVETVNPRWNDLRYELFGDEVKSILSKSNR